MNHAWLDLPLLIWILLSLNKYAFIIISDKCTGSCNALSPKICVPKERKDINVKTFNKVTNKNEAKAMTQHISCDCKRNLTSTICNSNQKWDDKTCQWEYKNYCKCKKYYAWNPRRCICENRKYLKSIFDTSVIECDEIIFVMDIVLTKKANAVATNVPSTASINCQ